MCWIAIPLRTCPLLVSMLLGYSSTCTGLSPIVPAFWEGDTPKKELVNSDRQPCTKSRRKKGNKSTWILRRCRARLTAYWAPHTPMHEKTPKEGNGQPPKGVGVKKTINVCPRGAGAVHELHPCIARYPLQQFYVNGEPIATFTRAMLAGVVLNLFASFISLKYC